MKQRWIRSSVIVYGLICAAALVGTARAERIDFLGPFVDGQMVTQVKQGSSFSLLARLSANNQIPLFGYSLNVDLTPSAGAIGDVIGDPTASNFYVQQNLITQGGGTLHPVLSLILAPGDDGLFVNGVNHIPVPVSLSVPGVNDILAELVFDTSDDALGFFTFDLGPGSVLSHVPNQEVPFDILTTQVEIIPVPEPSTLAGLIFMGLFVGGRGLKRKRSRKGKAQQS